jgi:hypothetical protein
MSFENLESRLENWARVVLSSGGSEDACALWAKWYILIRDYGKGDPKIAVIRNEMDGWLVERAWRSMPNHVAKWVLKYHYVWNMSPDQIQTRMWHRHKARVRRENLDRSLANGRQILTREIIRISGETVVEKPEKIACKLPETIL